MDQDGDRNRDGDRDRDGDRGRDRNRDGDRDRDTDRNRNINTRTWSRAWNLCRWVLYSREVCSGGMTPQRFV
jgi:hypothetical protein